jgi:signal transduction histidine kinase/ActR/RegA family two-component response regulator
MLLAASGLVPLMLMLAWGIHYLVQDRHEEAEQTALELSRALATGVGAELRSAAALLDHVGTSDELERADLRAFHMSAERTAQQLGWYATVLNDADGRPLLRSDAPYGTTPPPSPEPSSIAQVIETRTPAVSRVFQEGTLEVFAVRVPVLRGGNVVYVLSAILPTDVIFAVISRQVIPGASVVSVYDQVERKVARTRELNSLHPAPSLKLLLDEKQPHGTGRATTPDGVEHYVGYTRLPWSDWVVVVGSSIAEANKSLQTLLGAIALGAAASLAVSAFLAWVLSRQVLGPIDALKKAAAALGRGDAVEVPKLDIVELEGIGHALTDAARERDKAAGKVADALHVAEEASRSKDQFMAMLGHELRNPLAPIATAVQLMALKGDERTAQERRIIERQLGHVTRLVDDLLDISRITSGRLTIRREPLCIAELLRHVADGVQPSIQQRGLRLSLELQPEVEHTWVKGDEVRMAQVFNNLLVNAIKFTPQGGAIRVRARNVGARVQVDVEDTGIGLSPQQLERVFELFYQAPQSTDRAQGGLGLGLPIVKSLVAMHGGTVSAASAGPDRGACMTVDLPIGEPPPTAPTQDNAATSEGSGKVLVVDDNEDAANTCAALLEVSGYTVRVAYTPEHALQALAEFTPDIAVLDIGLPGMSGYALARLMKQAPHSYRGRLVALTGYGQATDRANSQAAGFDAHLTKPVPPNDLIVLIEKLIGPGSGSGDEHAAPG